MFGDFCGHNPEAKRVWYGCLGMTFLLFVDNVIQLASNYGKTTGGTSNTQQGLNVAAGLGAP